MWIDETGEIPDVESCSRTDLLTHGDIAQFVDVFFIQIIEVKRQDKVE